MTNTKVLFAALLLGVLPAAAASAQQVISNPGYCAQFYPNANCQNKGPGNPYTGDYQRRTGWQGGYAMAEPHGWRYQRRYHRRHHPR